MSGTGREGTYPLSFHLVWGTALMLMVVGLVLVYSVSSAIVLAGNVKDAALAVGYFRGQAATAAVGVALAALVFAVDYRKWRRLTPLAVALTLGTALLLITPWFGEISAGAERMLALGPVRFQPSELIKLAVVLLAAHLLSRSTGKLHPDDVRAVVVVGAVSCGLIVFQRDLGTGLVLGVALVGLLWVAGMASRAWTLLLAFLAVAATLAIVAMPYRMSRLVAFFSPEADPNASYQVHQGLVALGRGGLFGVGGGKSVQKLGYLPEPHTDMILAILGEEFGLVGVAGVVILFGLFAVSAFQLSRRCADPFGRYLIAGCAFLVYGQALINIGGVLAAVPLTGIPLPFISFGRNNLLVMLVSVGVILSVARWGPVVQAAPAQAVLSDSSLEAANVTHLDRGRRHSGARSARAGRR